MESRARREACLESLERRDEVQKMRSYRVCYLPLRSSFGRCCCSRLCYHDVVLWLNSARETGVLVLFVGRGASSHRHPCCHSLEAPLLAKWFLGGSYTHDEMVGGVGRMREHLLQVSAAVSIGRPRLSEWRQRDCSDLSTPPQQIVSSHKMATAVEKH